MDKDFWHERWQRGEIGFHQSDIHWALERHWSDISSSPVADAGVLVPLSGKSLDMQWLAGRGHAVTGVELSARAITEFFEEWGRSAERSRCGGLPSRKAEGVELAEGDFFDFIPAHPHRLFYDRAAMVALPDTMRPRYLAHLRECLTPDACGLLVTFEYDPKRMSGPPFSVPAAELSNCKALRFELLERRDVLTEHRRFVEQGLVDLHECAWRVTCA